MARREKLLGVLTARWVEGIGCLLLLVAIILRDRYIWWGVGGLVLLWSVTLLWCVIPAFGRLRRAWRDFPHTPEYEEWARRKAAESDESVDKPLK